MTKEQFIEQLKSQSDEDLTFDFWLNFGDYLDYCKEGNYRAVQVLKERVELIQQEGLRRGLITK